MDTLVSDRLVRWREPSQRLGGVSRRTIYVWVRNGRFPPPDRPAQKRGEPDLWLQSTVDRGVADFIAGRVKDHSRQTAAA